MNILRLGKSIIATPQAALDSDQLELGLLHRPNERSLTLIRAGGHWRSHAGDKEPEQQQWDMETYQHWLGTIENERDQPESGLISGLAVSPFLIFEDQEVPAHSLLSTVENVSPFQVGCPYKEI